MTTLWAHIGLTSLIAGTAAGLAWAMVSTSLRRRKFLAASLPPNGQSRWFGLQLLTMGGYIALITGLGLSAHHELLEARALWPLLGVSVCGYGLSAAIASASFEAKRRRERPDGIGVDPNRLVQPSTPS